MNRTQLVEEFARHASIPKKTARLIVDIFFGEIAKEMKKGGRAEFRGFGAFSLRKYKAFLGRNPSNGQPLEVPAKQLVHFKAFEKLLKKLNAESLEKNRKNSKAKSKAKAGKKKARPMSKEPEPNKTNRDSGGQSKKRVRRDETDRRPAPALSPSPNRTTDNDDAAVRSNLSL